MNNTEQRYMKDLAFELTPELSVVYAQVEKEWMTGTIYLEGLQMFMEMGKYSSFTCQKNNSMK
jgi:hypothetical protein